MGDRRRRDQIVDTALDLATTRGVEAITMRALGRDLGIEAMSLYVYFTNKDDLLQAMVAHLYGPEIADAVAVHQHDDTQGQQLARACQTVLIASATHDDAILPALVADVLANPAPEPEP